MNNPPESLFTSELSLTKAAEERKRDAYLAKHPELLWKYIGDAIAFAEASLPPHKRRNRPRQPHER